MMPRLGLAIFITPRDLPFGLIGAGGATLGVWVGAPAVPVVAVGFLVAMRVTIQRASVATASSFHGPNTAQEEPRAPYQRRTRR